jgi:hypothetical protein
MNAHREPQAFRIWNIIRKVCVRKLCNDGTKSERLAVLPDAEQYALYGLPDFDDGQRSEVPVALPTGGAAGLTPPGSSAPRVSDRQLVHSPEGIRQAPF